MSERKLQYTSAPVRDVEGADVDGADDDAEEKNEWWRGWGVKG